MPTEPLLQRRRIATIADLLCKVEANDWHGVADAAMDLREIDVQLKLLATPPPVWAGVDWAIEAHDHVWAYRETSDDYGCACGARHPHPEIGRRSS